MIRLHRTLPTLSLGLFLSLSGCYDLPYDPSGDGALQPGGPTDSNWASRDLVCQTSEQCLAGEFCNDGLCQPRTCAQDLPKTAPPLGDVKQLFAEKEIVVLDNDRDGGNYLADIYDVRSNSLSSGSGGFSLGNRRPRDVVGATVAKDARQAIVVAVEGRSTLRAYAADRTYDVNAGLNPTALAAGDVDHDGFDEVMAVDSSNLVLCHMEAGDCDRIALPSSAQVRGLAAADVDADGEVEALVHVEESGKSALWVGHLDLSGDEAWVRHGFNEKFESIAAGDLDGEGAHEIVFLEDGGLVGLGNDTVRVFRQGGVGFERITSKGVRNDSKKVEVGDTDGDGKADIVVLRGGNIGLGKGMELLRWNGGALSSDFDDGFSRTDDPEHVALVDRDGDSVTARLVDGPEMVPGRVVPIAAVTFPPYDEEFADGLPSVFIGDYGVQSTELSDSVSLSLGVEIGVEHGFSSFVKAGFSTKVKAEYSRTRKHERKLEYGTRLNIEPKTDLFGYQYGAVVLASGCFDMYTYELDDTRGIVGSDDGGRFVAMVPKGGQHSLWSTPRYNALADRLSHLPKITVSSRIGDVMSYPRTPTRLDGQPIEEDSLVFPELMRLQVSDVGTSGFHFKVAETNTIATNLKRNVEVAFSEALLGFKFGQSAGVGTGKGYAVKVGDEGLFRGKVPPVPDDPATPEDEFGLYNYGYKPVVYLHEYEDIDGEEAAFYALTYVMSGRN